MKVGVVTTSYPRWPGDHAGGFVHGFSRFLQGRGDRVEVVAAAPGARVVDDVAVTRVGAGASLFYREGAPETLARSRRAWLAAARFAVAQTAAVLRRAGAWDALVAHWLAPSGLAAAAAARGRPFLAVAHSGDVHLLCTTGLANPAVAALLAAGARIAFSGTHLRERLLRRLHLRLARALEAASFVCPMGADPPLRARAHVRTRARSSLLFLGRLVPIKGVHVLLDAMSLLDRPARLVVAGDGPERDRLQAAARARRLDAEFLGFVGRERRAALLAEADVVVVPSVDLADGRTEGTPVVALEALAAGVPLVASDVGGLAEAAAGRARLVPPGDAGALARALEDLLARPDATPASGEAYTWSRMGPRLLAGWLSPR